MHKLYDPETPLHSGPGGSDTTVVDSEGVPPSPHDGFYVPQVLLIEDNPGDVDLAKIAFEAEGVVADFQVARNGSEALAMLRSVMASSSVFRPDLVLLDLNIPMVDGREVLAFIKSHEVLRDIPTVVLTSSCADGDRERCAELGADDYVCKPNSLEQLLAMMKQLERWLH